jgi:2-oxoisovalerate dehydrogenase E1 component
MAHGISYLESQGLIDLEERPLVVCSLGDGSVTEGEVAEAMQMAVLKKLPIFYLIQDNDWGISASGSEMRAMDAYEYAAGFKGLQRLRVDGSDFEKSWIAVHQCIDFVREQRAPILLHAKVPLLGHHTSGVRREWYRTEEDMAKHSRLDPLDKMYVKLVQMGISEKELEEINATEIDKVAQQFKQALEAENPSISTATDHVYAPSNALTETGIRIPIGKEPVVMVDAALHAVDELMNKHPECIFYGQDVGLRLGGVFREAATLAAK